jgi:mannose-6-phosphate isomerase class I
MSKQGHLVVEVPPAAVEVQAAVQNYEWGVQGGANNGLVARMAKAPPAEGTPFAELWMGTHPKAPLTIVDAGGAAAPGTHSHF